MSGSCQSILDTSAIRRLRTRAYQRLDPAHVNTPYTPQAYPQISTAIYNDLVDRVTRVSGDEAFGASIIVIITISDLLAGDDELVKASTYYASGKKLALEMAALHGVVRVPRVEPDGILFYQIVCNGPLLGDVVHGTAFIYDTNCINRTCAKCKAKGLEYSICSRCEKIYYCGVACQREHWPEHMYKCNKK